LKIDFTNAYKRDIRIIEKRNYNLSILKDVITRIANKEVLEPKYHVHSLKGEYANMYECHIKPNWLLIWQIYDDLMILHRTGTHSDLFD
ncbi:MAG: type II toxin-antitoxin system YafQ family toxin, partial [Christensenellaceae bacterium]|nr:type II toxin-antitoxin system YafQ family toxin [Christensenellaceae bacterium]